MTQYVINIGTFPNDGTGDPLRTAFNEVNLNFDQVFAAGPVLSNIQIANNTILTTNTNGNLVLAPNGIGVVQANVNIVPNTSNIRNLGSADRRWSTVYLQYANISGNLSVGGNFDVAGDLTVGANLSVTGNIINVANIITDAKTIQLANTATSANSANGSGITVGANDSIATFLFDSANAAWTTNIGLQVGGPITGTSIAVSDATIYGNLDAINGNFTGTVTSPNIVVNNISSDDSTFVTIQDGLDVNGAIVTENITVNGTAITGNIVPAANITYSLGNSSLWWSNIWVAGNTIYIGGVPIGMGSGNVLTVDGKAVLQNDSNTTISTTGNITADYFFGNGSQLTNLPSGVSNAISNGTSNVDIANVNGPVTINVNGTETWEFDDAGNLTLPTNGSIVVDGGDGFIGPISDDLIISWDNEEIKLVSVQGSIEMQADNAFRVQTNYDGANVLYASRWEFSNNELINISNNFGIVSEAGNLTLSGGRDGVNSGNTIISAVNLGNAVVNWTFGNNGVLSLPNGGEIDNSDDNIELRSNNNINFETANVVNVYTSDGNYQWQFGDNGALTLASITTGEGTGESATVKGSRTVVGGFDAALPYVVELPGHTEFGNVVWTASSGTIQSAKITFVVQSSGSAFQWEQFDVSVCKFDGANAFVTVSNRIKYDTSVADTQVEAYDGEGSLAVWLNPADGQTIAWVNYQAVEFGLMVD